MKPRPTRADVAEQAGVSKTTVTYVMGERHDIAIPERTRERVRAAARLLGYRPHATAQALASGRTNAITVAFPVRIGSHYAHVLQAFERQADAHGCHLIASTVGHVNVENVLPDLWGLLGGMTDGLILVDMPAGFQPYVDEMLPSAKPIVSMGVFTVPSIDSVEIDLTLGIRDALAHLLEARPRRIAYFGPSAAFEGDPRPAAYRSAMEQAGRPVEMIVADPADRTVTMEALRTHVAAHGCPDALFCFNDEIAISASRALREMGRSVPDDVLLVGCDGSEEGEYVSPALSTISQPLGEACLLAWDFMARRLADAKTPRQHAAVRAEFIVRDSSRLGTKRVEINRKGT